MVRTAYDADTQQYTFFDTTTQTHYVSAPGEAYGTLVPAATANFPKPSRSTGRKPTRTYSSPLLFAMLITPHAVQAYERTVFFADDTMFQRHSSPSKGNKSSPPTSVYRSSTTVHKHGHGGSSGRKRSASFSDLLPPHLITSASKSQNGSASPAKPSSTARARGGAPLPLEKKVVPSSPSSSNSRSPSPYEDEKKSSPWWSPTAAEALLPSLPPAPPPKDTSPVSPGDGSHGTNGGIRVPGLAALRVLGRTLDAVKGAHRSRGEQPNEDEWVVV